MSHVEMRNDVEKWKRAKIYDNNAVLIKPEFDASDKEIFAKNGYRTNA
jgi:hypothetical protein